MKDLVATRTGQPPQKGWISASVLWPSYAVSRYLPKMIRPYFHYHPELRGKLCRAAYETVQEVMAAAAVGCEGFRTGMVAVTATSGDLLNFNSHVHAIAPRGGWDEDGDWVPVPYIDKDVAERLFRRKVLNFLTCEGLLSDERARILMSWNHNSGFSIDDSVRVEPVA